MSNNRTNHSEYMSVLKKLYGDSHERKEAEDRPEADSRIEDTDDHPK